MLSGVFIIAIIASTALALYGTENINRANESNLRGTHWDAGNESLASFTDNNRKNHRI